MFLFTLTGQDEPPNIFESSICLTLDGSGVFLVLTANMDDSAPEYKYKVDYFGENINIACILFTPGYTSLYHKIKIIDDGTSYLNETFHLKLEVQSALDISVDKRTIQIWDPEIELDELIKNNYLSYSKQKDSNYISLKNCPYFIFFNASYKYRYCLSEVKREHPVLNYDYTGYE
jgi:hypothetical protein